MKKLTGRTCTGETSETPPPLPYTHCPTLERKTVRTDRPSVTAGPLGWVQRGAQETRKRVRACRAELRWGSCVDANEWVRLWVCVYVCVVLNWVMRTAGGAKDKHAPSSSFSSSSSSRCTAGSDGGRTEEGSQHVSPSQHWASDAALIPPASKESLKLKSISRKQGGSRLPAVKLRRL